MLLFSHLKGSYKEFHGKNICLGALLQSSYCNLEINLTTYYSCLQSQNALTILGISFLLKVYSKQIYEGEMLLKTHTYCDLMFYLDP